MKPVDIAARHAEQYSNILRALLTNQLQQQYSSIVLFTPSPKSLTLPSN